MAREATAATEAIPMPRDRGETVVWSDEQLLRQFLSRTDESAEAAFATLIERHGPIVHRVCLDVLRDREGARDAAQAVFLVLARKAGSIRKPESLGPWLHGVALRLARRARSEEARRQAAERGKGEIMLRRQTPDVGPEPFGDAELHEEVERLPEKYRKPIILCYMQGRTQAEAAEELGWPLGTVQVRLHRGRDRLRSKLMRRGVGPIVLAGSGLVRSLSAKAGVPGRGWTDATATAAVRFASGKGTAGLVAPAVTGLAESALAAMLWDPLKAVALLAIALLLGSGALSLTGLSKRAVTATGLHAEPEPATADPVGPRTTPKLTLREIPAATVVGADQVAGSPARGRGGLEERPTPGTPSRGPLNEGGVLRRSYTSPGRSQDSAPVDRRLQGAPNQGRELFERVWVKDDPRSHGGDGLGPVFNGTSCVACHHLGGPGGAGGVDRNIEIATATGHLTEGTGFFYAFSMDFGAGRFDHRIGNPPGPSSRSVDRLDPRALATIHPGFLEARSVVLHSFGTDPAYNAWRESVPGRHGTVLVRTSERNPPPLFGAGLIDAIPDEAIEAAAKRKFPGSSAVRGRVSRLKDGRIGRFGWKAQTATLKEFVLSAAAGEMGLEVPGRHQAADPRFPGIGASGLDMDEAECDALTDYVRSLPAPVAVKPADDQESAQVRSGEETFRAIGCAHCHLPKLGGIDGIYSDLLLHDMSPRLEDSAAYSVFVGDPPRAGGAEAPDRPGAGAASIQEWRTPPLWGLRDSGPYLHDGRAATVDQAVALHAGQGASSARRYAELSPRRKRHLAAFLMSLAAPSANR
jgi:RNA polymerase sigma factor (sigma-70 family)